MKEMNLFSLSATIVTSVLSNLGCLKDAVHLDSAYCHQRCRTTWLELLRSKVFTLCCPVDISNREALSWMLSKDAQCSSIKFASEKCGFKDVSDFLRTKGGSVRTVHFHSGTKALEMVLVASHCHNLAAVEISGLDVTCAFREILLRNPNIQKIRCSKVKCTEDDIFAGVSLHKLQVLSTDDANCMKGFPWHETARSESLHTVLWDDSDFYMSNLDSLLRNCPHIRNFSATYDHCSYANCLLPSVGIQNMSISNNEIISDAHLLNIATRLTSLRALNIQNCDELTDACLQHLAEHAGDRLEVLYVDIKHPESAQTEAILELFSQKCTKLKYLNINCGDKSLCTGRATSLIVCGCPELRTLVVNKYESIGASSRDMISKFRPELKLLVHDNSTMYDKFFYDCGL